MARTTIKKLNKTDLRKILNKMGSEFDQSWTEAQLLEKIRETVEEPEPDEVFLEVNPPQRRRSLRLSIQAEAASKTETSPVRVHGGNQRQATLNRKKDRFKHNLSWNQ